MKQINGINNSSQNELTYEQIKKYKGFENTNEAEAEKQIEFIKRMAKVMFYMYTNEQKQNNTDYENRP